MFQGKPRHVNIANMLCKRKLQFCEVKFDQNGNIIPRKKPRLTPQRENETKGEDSDRGKVQGTHGSILTPQQFLGQKYHQFIAPAPRPETKTPSLIETNSVTTQEESASPCPRTTTLQTSPMSVNTNTNVNWVQRVSSFIAEKAPQLSSNSWKYGEEEHCCISLRDLSGYDPNQVLSTGISPVALHVSENGRYVVKVFCRDTGVKGTLKDEKDFASLVSVVTHSVVCPGLKEAPTVESASKRTWGFPFERTDSKHCLLLHIPRNKKQKSDSLLYNVCRHCKKLHYKLKDIAQKRDRKGKERLSKSSNCNWRFLSPKSAKKRFRHLTAAARKLEKEVRRLNKKVQVTLSSEFSDQMENLTGKISSQFQGNLDAIFQEADKDAKGNGRLLKEIWKRDVEDRKEFWGDQNRNGKIKIK